VRRPARSLYYPWLVVALASVTVGVAFGCRSTFAVFLVAVIEEFGWSRAATSGALFLGAVVWSLAATFIGMLLDRFGPRVVFPLGALVMALGFTITGMTQNIAQFYVGMGIFMALGFASLPMSTQATIISNWFVSRRGAAMGIAASGMGVGIFVLVPLAEFLIATRGWRISCFILAGLLVALIAPANAAFQRHRPEDVGLSADGSALSKSPRSAPREKSWTLKSALRNYRFWALAFGTLTGAIPLHMILIHQVAALVDHGYPKALAASILGLTGLFTSPSMILWGAASDRIGREWAYTLGSGAMILGTLLLLYARDPSQVWMLYLYALLFALGFGTRQALYPTIAADLFHGTNFGAINGALALFIGAGSGIGPWLGGHLFDRFGNYDAAFWSANLLVAVSVSLIWAAGPRHSRFSR
jgi:MFS family permease